MSQFDPYAEWLERPPGQPPADHYELLGLPRFEPDPELICHAADTLRARIRKIRPGPHLGEWQRLLDRVEAAKRCLCDPIGKAAYDESIDSATHTLNVSESPVVTSPDPEPPSLEEESPRADAIPPDGGDVEPPPIVEAATATVASGPCPATTDEPIQAHLPATGRRPVNRLLVGIAVMAASFLAVVGGAGILRLWVRYDDPPTDTRIPDVNERPSPEDPQAPPREPVSAGTVAGQDTEPLDETPTRNASETGQLAQNDLDTSGQIQKASADPAGSKVDHAADQAFRRAAEAVRTALGHRDLASAQERLAEMKSLALTDEQRRETDRLEALHAYVDAFWGSLQDLLPKLETGSEFMVGEGVVLVVESGPGFLVLREAGQNRRYSILGMSHPLTAAIAEQTFSKSPNAKALRAAFLIAQPDGDEHMAAQLLQEASQAGVQVDELLEELTP